jgi:hypothetical protein
MEFSFFCAVTAFIKTEEERVWREETISWINKRNWERTSEERENETRKMGRKRVKELQEGAILDNTSIKSVIK